jgi:hypothetical protein
VYCPGGRWGPRRVRVTDCAVVVRAEDLYTTLHEDQSGPKNRGQVLAERLSFESMNEN